MRISHRLDCWIMLAGLLLTLTVYWPGLSGGYLFDDYPNFVDNPVVHVGGLGWRQWRGAALASPSADLRRPLAMLSLAANYYFTGLDPFPAKLLNLAIHLGNGVLLWRVLLATLGFWQRRQAASDATIQRTALALTCLWLLAPINVSTVLYVVQRMESLAQLFVLAGLWAYLAGRRRMLSGGGGAALAGCVAGLVCGSLGGLLCKESAALLPLYAFLLECAVLRFEAPDRNGRRGLWLAYGPLLFIPLALGLAWLLPRELDGAAYADRPFTLPQRLLTECRVLVDYLQWTLLPLPGKLSFYHDDMLPSRGWLNPPATLWCAALLAGLAAAAITLRRRRPLLALGIGWYFAAHALTATIIPLELVFEHRNYFASIGLLLAAADLVLLIPPQFGLLRHALPLLALGLFALTSASRTLEWSHPITLAYAEAFAHPQSPRANYELGRALAVASGYRPDSKLVDPAMAAFERAAQLPGAGATPWAGLIVVAGHMHRPVSPAWWAGLSQALQAEPPSQQSISALESLNTCQHQGECPPQAEALLQAYLGALSHPGPSARLLAAYGTFAANQLGDYAVAEHALSDALQQEPGANGIRFDLVQVLLLEGKFDSAERLLAPLEHAGLSDADARHLAELKTRIASGRRKTGA